MSNNSFSGLEMLKVAILMEEEGYNFYRNGANNTSGKTKEFLIAAASQEFFHKEKFLQLYDELKKGDEAGSEYLYDEEVTNYLRSLIENHVFNKKDEPKEAFKDFESAVLSSLKTEELTVTVYNEMYKGISNHTAKEVMQKIIEEEKQHVEYFKNLLKA